ncbi:MAG: iron ABC transporter permease [Alphaproteobacteria bacterium]|nr:iron ABC transporter permease [Alphaproteobacteria bacterium]
MSAHALPPAGTVAGYRRLARRRTAVVASAGAALAASALLDIATGPAMLPLGQVVRTVLAPIDTAESIGAIVWTIRLPIAFMAVVAGAALGLSGAVMQTVLNNPLASSYTLGISAGAGFGAALAIALGGSLPLAAPVAVPLSAFAFAATTCFVVFAIGRARGMMPETMVLAGIGLLFLFQALQSLLQFLVSPETLQAIVFWLFGSLLKSTWNKVWIVAAVLAVGMPLVLADAWRLTALKLGAERAGGLGIDVAALRLRMFLLVSALTAIAVAFVGTIGFIGLVAPHVARMLVGEDHRFLLPMSALSGAVLLSAASVASKSVHPGTVFPIGIVTAMLGVPFFFALVLRNKRGYW